MRAITYRGRLAAFAEDQHVLLAPHIGALEVDHPERRFVCCLCIHSCEVDEGLVRAAYTDRGAAAAARAMLMAAEAFIAYADLPGHELAGLFCVPLDQVAARRGQLAHAHR